MGFTLGVLKFSIENWFETLELKGEFELSFLIYEIEKKMSLILVFQNSPEGFEKNDNNKIGLGTGYLYLISKWIGLNSKWRQHLFWPRFLNQGPKPHF